MPVYIALLRGVNVGGNTLAMERLRALWTEAGFGDVRTYVQSGNVVFSASGTPGKWLPAIERLLTGQTRLPVSVVVRSKAEWQKLIAANPWVGQPGVDPSKLHVMFLRDSPSKAAWQKLAQADAGGDAYQVVGKQIYLHCPGGYGTSKLVNNRLERLPGVTATTRNWNTVGKLLELACQ